MCTVRTAYHGFVRQSKRTLRNGLFSLFDRTGTYAMKDRVSSFSKQVILLEILRRGKSKMHFEEADAKEFLTSLEETIEAADLEQMMDLFKMGKNYIRSHKKQQLKIKALVGKGLNMMFESVGKDLSYEDRNKRKEEIWKRAVKSSGTLR